MERWFSEGIIDWYAHNKRDLPWRHHKDPYKIWLSEVILQQTQVAQGLSYYEKFVQRYPTVSKLARAHQDEVLKLWQGLGYYSRARNMHASAKYIHEVLRGRFPEKLVEIKALKGVGDYTAAAIASFAFDLPQAVVDGNVHRVLSRVFGIELVIASAAAKREFQLLAEQLLDKKRPALHNQAIMEFGALYCKPVNPHCEQCIFGNKCLAFKMSKVEELPMKKKKGRVKKRFFNYFVVIDKNGKAIINQRGAGDIWQGLYEFVLVETKKETPVEKLLDSKELKKYVAAKGKVIRVSKKYKHILSHQHLISLFYVLRISTSHKKSLKSCAVTQISKFAFPRLIEKFLNDCDLREIN